MFTLFNVKKLHIKYSVKFNNAKMIRITRVSLKHVYKKFIKIKIINVYKNVIFKNE